MSYSFHGRFLDPTTLSVVQNAASWRQMGHNSFGQCQWLILKDLPYCQWVPPQNGPLTFIQLESLQRSLTSAVHFLSIPLIVTSNRWFEMRHIVHLLVNKKMNQIEYFDSRGLEIKTYPEAEAVFKMLRNSDTELIQNKQLLQYRLDGFNCGPLVLYYLHQRVGRGVSMGDIAYPDKGILQWRHQMALQLADECAKNRDSMKEWQLVDEEERSVVGRPAFERPPSQMHTQCLENSWSQLEESQEFDETLHDSQKLSRSPAS